MPLNNSFFSFLQLYIRHGASAAAEVASYFINNMYISFFVLIAWLFGFFLLVTGLSRFFFPTVVAYNSFLNIVFFSHFFFFFPHSVVSFFLYNSPTPKNFF